MVVISKNQRIPTSLFLSILAVLILFNISTLGYAFTYEDVQHFLDNNPAPTGCYNRTENYTNDGQQGIKVLKRCGSAGATARSEWWALYVDGPYRSGYAYLCDGSGKYVEVLNGKIYWPLISCWSNTIYCDGHNVVTTGCSTAPAGLTELCNFWTVDSSFHCTTYDTPLAEFIPIDECQDPCCGDPCCGGCCIGGGSGSGNNAGTAGNP